MERPTYHRQPIQSIEALCRALSLAEPFLLSMVKRVPKLYIGPMSVPKKDGKGVRQICDTRLPLKLLLKKINDVFLRQVSYPVYLQGSLRGRDFVSNAGIHVRSRILFKEDIAQFFDCITYDHVYRIWNKLFGFAPAPSSILAALTTNIDQEKRHRVFQGTPTSSYLANLVFWDVEHKVVEKISARGIRYSRYVDDITLSSKQFISREDVSWAIAQVYAMMGSRGFRPRRDKHSMWTSHSPISVMGVNVNRQATFSKEKRSGVRAGVHQVEQQVSEGVVPELRHTINKVRSGVGQLGRLHPPEASALKGRIKSSQKTVDNMPHLTEPTKPTDHGDDTDGCPF